MNRIEAFETWIWRRTKRVKWKERADQDKGKQNILHIVAKGKAD